MYTHTPNMDPNQQEQEQELRKKCSTGEHADRVVQHGACRSQKKSQNQPQKNTKMYVLDLNSATCRLNSNIRNYSGKMYTNWCALNNIFHNSNSDPPKRNGRYSNGGTSYSYDYKCGYHSINGVTYWLTKGPYM